METDLDREFEEHGNQSGISQADLSRIWSWNGECPQRIEMCVHSMFEKRAYESPDTIAICAWDGKLSYGELDKLTTRLALHLIELGVVPGMIVPLCFEKSIFTTVALLAVLKAGAGFLLLDSSIPQIRMKQTVQQVNPLLILSSTSNKDISHSLCRNVIPINQQTFDSLPNHGISTLKTNFSPSSIASVTFTSGSTGTPKGVLLTHSNYASALHHQTGCLGLTPEWRVYDFASYTFDASIACLFTTLMAGGCLCVPSEHDRINNLAQSITSLRANVAVLTPSVARLLTPTTVPTIHTITFIGEPLLERDIATWWGKARILNVYGPAECTPYSIINSDASSPREATRLGKGTGQVTWIVDPTDNETLLPIGAVGELLLEGPLVGGGYLGDDAKTIRAFIAAPSWLKQGYGNTPGRPEARVYRTGDMVHYNEDGSLTYVGRTDLQVKLNGQRIDLREIETTILGLDLNVFQVVVDVINWRDKALAAFVQHVSDQDSSNSMPTNRARIHLFDSGILAKLRNCLPSYMVPTLLFRIQEWPTTLSGKLDRSAIRDLGVNHLQNLATTKSEELSKPESTSEKAEVLRRIVGQVLQIDLSSVRSQDSFLRLGGDSITAMKVASEARSAGIGLTVSTLLQSSSLASLDELSDSLIERHIEEINPFSLLPGSTNVPLLLSKIQLQYGIHASKIEDVYPCTPLQEALFLTSLATPGEYITQRVLRIQPDINIDRFCSAWGCLAKALPILRTRIISNIGNSSYQIVLSENIKWVRKDCLDSYLAEDREIPTQPGEPLCRYALITTATSTERWFVWTLHHSLYDGWTFPLMARMVEKIYNGSDVQSSATDFKRFIKYIVSQDPEKAKQYWQTSLSRHDYTTFPNFPASIHQTNVNSQLKIKISDMKRRGCVGTTSTMVRAAWALVASTMTNSDHVAFGAIVSGRNAPLAGMESIMGPTIATVPIVVDICRSQKVFDYLEAMQRQSVSMIPFEQIGLSKLSRLCCQARQMPLFRTLLIFQSDFELMTDCSLGTWLDGLEQELTSEFPLVLEIKDGSLNARFDSRAIETWNLKLILGRFEFVLKQLSAATSETTLDMINILTARDLEIIWRHNHVVPPPIEASVVDLIQKPIVDQPDDIAIRAWDGDLTYAELNQISIKIASKILGIDVPGDLLGPQKLIPLCFEKSKWVVPAVLGVLKAGAAFVLLDPSFPEARLQKILHQVDSRILIVCTKHKGLGQRLCPIVLEVSDDSMGDCHLLCPRSLTLPTGSDTLYGVFTSGSTGTPKCVLVSHQNFASAIHYQLDTLRFSRNSRVLDFATYAFDAAIHNMLATLIAGGCLCIPAESDRMNINEIMRTIQPTIANLTPTVARLFDLGASNNLETVIFLGEEVTPADVERWQSTGVRLINAYGPAECTPISTINTRTSTVDEACRIGRGFGALMWIIHPHDHTRLVPPGCTGELLLEGPIVGKGYLNDTYQTDATFIEPPEWLLQAGSGGSPRSSRLYKTGDLVRMNEDGSLTYVGRKDTQVKIRGQRVELGEIESLISSHLTGSVDQIVVEAFYPLRSTGPIVAAFIRDVTMEIPSENRDDLPEIACTSFTGRTGIRTALKAHLPSHMLPSLYIRLPQFPMTVTGKLDRKRLREIGCETFDKESHKFLDGLRNGTSLENIHKDEEPAYSIAEKIHTLRPPFIEQQDGLSHPNDSFSDVEIESTGLNSLDIMHLSTFIFQRFGVKLDIRLLTDRAITTRGLAQAVLESQKSQRTSNPAVLAFGTSSTGVDIMAEIERHDRQIAKAQGKRSVLLHNTEVSSVSTEFTVLLTGASGFLGSQILRQLLQCQQIARVICLVRATSKEMARERVVAKAVESLWWDGLNEEKLEVWHGDLTHPHMGLNSISWESLISANRVNIIIHCAAIVHWTKTFAALEPVNVNSTVELLQLAVQNPDMKFVYISGGRQWNSVVESEEEVAKELSSGDTIAYSQTKFVAEAVIRRASLRDTVGASRLMIVSPGTIIGTPTEGFCNKNDYIWRLVAACIRIGGYNSSYANSWLSISDVQTTAKVTVQAALNSFLPTDGTSPTSCSDGMTWEQFWSIVNDCGYNLGPMPSKEWLDKIHAALAVEQDAHPLWPLAHLLESDALHRDPVKMPGQSTRPAVRSAVRKCVEFLIESAFLPVPDYLSGSDLTPASSGHQMEEL